MSPIPNPSVIFAERPVEYPIPGQHLVYRTGVSIDLDSVPLDGGVLAKTLSISLDPVLRLRMRAAFEIGKP